MDNKWPQPLADIQEFQKEYFLSYGAAKAYEKLVLDLSTSEAKMRDVQNRIEQEKLKHGL